MEYIKEDFEVSEKSLHGSKWLAGTRTKAVSPNGVVGIFDILSDFDPSNDADVLMVAAYPESAAPLEVELDEENIKQPPAKIYNITAPTARSQHANENARIMVTVVSEPENREPTVMVNDPEDIDAIVKMAEEKLSQLEPEIYSPDGEVATMIEIKDNVNEAGGFSNEDIEPSLDDPELSQSDVLFGMVAEYVEKSEKTPKLKEILDNLGERCELTGICSVETLAKFIEEDPRISKAKAGWIKIVEPEEDKPKVENSSEYVTREELNSLVNSMPEMVANILTRLIEYGLKGLVEKGRDS